jgi:hypothetical protein
MGAAGRILTLTLALLLGLTCSCRHRAPASLAERPAQVRYRHGEPNSEAGVWLLERIEGARWDPALLAAARELSAGAADPGARLTPEAVRIATGRAGFPGDARFARLYNGGAHPEALLHDAMAAQGDAPSLDVALASRRYADGTVLWIMGVAPHWGEVDPYPRDLALDDSLALQVDVPGARELQLIVAPPHGLVQRMGISSGVARWVDLFHLPGEYRLEVVDVGRDRSRVVFDMAVFVEHEVSSGVLAHVIPGVTPGVGARAWDEFHPRAQHYEDLAAAYSPEEALALVWASPGHRNNLLCEHCTHASIGVALEPSVSSPPRLFVTWELLAFPEGTPVELPQTRR